MNSAGSVSYTHLDVYKRQVRYKGIVCDKCGVEITRSSVRRERLGHIELAAPVAHVWYTRRVPSYMGLLLNISRRNLDRVLYFAQYVITHVDEESRQRALKRLDEELQEAESQLDTKLREQLQETTGEAATRPVSYTHLDVYKRQA